MLWAPLSSPFIASLALTHVLPPAPVTALHIAFPDSHMSVSSREPMRRDDGGDTTCGWARQGKARLAARYVRRGRC